MINMKKCLLFAGLMQSIFLFAQPAAIKYTVDSASVEHAGVPKGEILKFTFNQSKIFPGTTREYWVYVPVQYKADKPACVYINQDGIQWKAPTVAASASHCKVASTCRSINREQCPNLRDFWMYPNLWSRMIWQKFSPVAMARQASPCVGKNRNRASPLTTAWRLRRHLSLFPPAK